MYPLCAPGFELTTARALVFLSRTRPQQLRDTLTLSSWVWTITVYVPNHPAASPTLLALLAGQRSFAGKKTDICNNYFVYVGYAIVAIIILVSSVILCFLAIIVRLAWDSWRTGFHSFTDGQHDTDAEDPKPLPQINDAPKVDIAEKDTQAAAAGPVAV